jgi:hypothetical protein
MGGVSGSWANQGPHSLASLLTAAQLRAVVYLSLVPVPPRDPDGGDGDGRNADQGPWHRSAKPNDIRFTGRR